MDVLHRQQLLIKIQFLHSSKNKTVCLPVLTKRLSSIFDAGTNSVAIIDSDAETQLETILFHDIPNLNLDRIPVLRSELEENNYHPFDRNDTFEYLRRLVNTLSSKSIFSFAGVPSDWESEADLLITPAPP